LQEGHLPIAPRADLVRMERAMRLKGYAAIEFAEKQGLALNKLPGPDNTARKGLTIAEAEAVATEDEDLIYLDISDDEYREAPPTSFEPER
jgi:hypothetical protein